MRSCVNCNQVWPEDRFTNSDWCFRCRARGISFSYGAGGSDGKKFFHDDTIKAYQDRQISEAAANGIEAVPAWTKTNYGFASARSEKVAAEALASGGVASQSAVGVAK